jgi:hypothetical protein
VVVVFTQTFSSSRDLEGLWREAAWLLMYLDQTFPPISERHHADLGTLSLIVIFFSFLFVFLMVLGFGLRAYTLRYSTSPFCDFFFSR